MGLTGTLAAVAAVAAVVVLAGRMELGAVLEVVVFATGCASVSVCVCVCVCVSGWVWVSGWA